MKASIRKSERSANPASARPVEASPVDPLERYTGKTETVAASIPRSLLREVQSLLGDQSFSRFVAIALAREVADRHAENFLNEMPTANEERVKRFNKLLGR